MLFSRIQHCFSNFCYCRFYFLDPMIYKLNKVVLFNPTLLLIASNSLWTPPLVACEAPRSNIIFCSSLTSYSLLLSNCSILCYQYTRNKGETLAVMPHSRDAEVWKRKISYPCKYDINCHKLTNLCLQSIYFLLMLVVTCLLKLPPNQFHLMRHQLQLLFQLPIPKIPCFNTLFTRSNT